MTGWQDDGPSGPRHGECPADGNDDGRPIEPCPHCPECGGSGCYDCDLDWEEPPRQRGDLVMATVTREQVADLIKTAPCLLYPSRHRHAIVVNFAEHVPCILAAIEPALWNDGDPPPSRHQRQTPS